MNLTELFEKMETAVLETVEHYQTDFYDYDKKWIEENYPRQSDYIWLLRDSGTHLTNPITSYGLSVLNCTKVERAFLIKAGSEFDLTEITIDEARAYINRSTNEFEGKLSYISEHLCLIDKHVKIRKKECYIDSASDIMYFLVKEIFDDFKLSYDYMIRLVRKAMATSCIYENLDELAAEIRLLI